MSVDLTTIQQYDEMMRRLIVEPGEGEVYRVGGSVRDELMHVEPVDPDYVVRNVSIERLHELLGPECDEIMVGRVQVGWRLHGIDVMLPRVESSSGLTRHSFEVRSDPYLTLQADSARRDLTVNALYLDLRTWKVLDPTYMGRMDLAMRLARTTYRGSFHDDPLRILRALRFVSTHDFELAPNTAKEMSDDATGVSRLIDGGPSATVMSELVKLMDGRWRARALRVMRDTGVLVSLMPELAPMIGYDQRSKYHDKTVDDHTFDAIEHLPASARVSVALALLFHDAGKPATAWEDDGGNRHYYSRSCTELSHEQAGALIAERTLTRLGTPRRLRQEVVYLVREHMLKINDKQTKINRLRVRHGDQVLRDLIQMRLADVLGKRADDIESSSTLMRMENMRQHACACGVPRHHTELAISGLDIKELGARTDDIRHVLRELLDQVACQPSLNNKEWLSQSATKIIKKLEREHLINYT